MELYEKNMDKLRIHKRNLWSILKENENEEEKLGITPYKKEARDGNPILYIEKNGVKLDVDLVNFSEMEVYVENCAVYEMCFDGYDFEKVEKDFLKLPNGITLLSPEDEIDAVCKNFERSEGTSYVSYNYNDYYYTKEVKIWISRDSSYSDITVKNTEWDY